MATENDHLLGHSGSSSTNSRSELSWWKYAATFLAGIALTLLMVRFIPTSPVFAPATQNGGGPSRSIPLSDDTSPKESVTMTVEEKMSGKDVFEINDDRRYKATQFISFTINTLGGNAKHGECNDRKVDPDTDLCYLGNKSNITEDIFHRLHIVEDVLNRLRVDIYEESPDIDRSPDVLKIFMMPEFFLRGPHGAYSTSQLTKEGILSDVGDAIRDVISSFEFEDYLFVFGTVIAAHSPDSSTKPWEEEEAEDVMYFNFAPVYRGGTHEESFVVTKRYISGADFLKRTNLPEPTSKGLHGYADLTKSLQENFAKRGVNVVEDSVIVIDGIRIGLEICLDHRMGKLWDSLRMNHDSQLVDVQLIVSAGMAIERGPNPIVPGGVVYLSDGDASSAACQRSDTGKFDSNTVCRGEISGLKHIPQGGRGYSDFFPLTACIDLESIDLLKGYYSLYQTQGCAYTLNVYGIDVFDEFSYYPPSIEVYPTVALPGFENEQ